MKWKNYFLSVFLLLFNIELVINSACQKNEARLKSMIRGKWGLQSQQNYKMDLLETYKEVVYVILFYTITTGYGYTASTIGNSIILDLQKQQELNTLKIWLWDQTYRFYSIKIQINTIMQKQISMKAILYKAQLLLSFLTNLFKNFKYSNFWNLNNYIF